MQSQKLNHTMENKNKIIRYFGTAFEIPYIRNESYVPVGGKNMFSNDLDLELFIDKDNLNEFISAFKEKERTIDKRKLELLLEAQRADVDINLFRKLLAFNKTFDSTFGFSGSVYGRVGMYRSGKPRLSLVLSKGLAECAEIACLAQLYLQEEVDCSYFGGEALSSEDSEVSKPHAFIYLGLGKNEYINEYIYDPTNPHVFNNGQKVIIPTLCKADGFKKEVSKGKKVFVKTKDILGFPDIFYGYGVSNGTNVNKENLIRCN